MNFLHKIPVYIFNIFYPVKFYGRENVPDGGALLVCNHFRGIDCGFIARLYSKDISFLAKEELFKNKLFAKIIKSFGAIPVNRENPGIGCILKCVSVLKSGHKLVIFPEGTRNASGTNELQEIKSGPSIFSVKAKCPVVPLMILDKPRAFRKTHLIIGKPFDFSEYYGKKITDEDIKAMDEVIRVKMIEEHKKLIELLDKKKHK